jgi:hypothetical protein
VRILDAAGHLGINEMKIEFIIAIVIMNLIKRGE